RRTGKADKQPENREAVDKSSHRYSPHIGRNGNWPHGNTGNSLRRGEEAVAAAIARVPSDDLPGLVDSSGLGLARARRVERRVAAIHIQQETVLVAASVKVPSDDLAAIVDPEAKGLGRAGHVERGEAAYRGSSRQIAAFSGP